MNSLHHKRSRTTDGFTLIEVALALAVAVFAVVGILGMFSSGLQSSRGVANNTIAGAIGQSLIQQFETQGDLTGNPYRRYATFPSGSASLTYGGSTTIYYASDGTFVGATLTNGGFRAIASLTTNNITIPNLYRLTVAITWPIPSYLNTNTYTTLTSFP